MRDTIIDEDMKLTNNNDDDEQKIMNIHPPDSPAPSPSLTLGPSRLKRNVRRPNHPRSITRTCSLVCVIHLVYIRSKWNL